MDVGYTHRTGAGGHRWNRSTSVRRATEGHPPHQEDGQQPVWQSHTDSVASGDGILQAICKTLQEVLEERKNSSCGRGRKPLLVAWISRIGADRAAEITARVVLAELHRRPVAGPLCERVVDEIVHEATSRESADQRALSPASAATLGWSLIDAMIEAVRRCQGAESLQLVMQTQLRRVGRGVARRDCYHLVASDRLLGLLYTAGCDLFAGDVLALTAAPIHGTGDVIGRAQPERGRGTDATHKSQVQAPAGSELVSAMEAVQGTSWRINRAVLRTASELLAHDARGDVDADGLIGPDGIRAIHAAQRVAGEAARVPYYLDLRGQMHAAGSLSPQGTDLEQALLIFATGKPIGRSGVHALAIHGATALGIGRHLSPEESARWIEDHTAHIVECAGDPLRERWWMSADQPWTFLAFCHEWTAYIESGRDEAFVSSQPVGVALPDADPRLIDALLSPQENRAEAWVAQHRPYLDEIIVAVRASLEGAVGGEALAERWLESRANALLERIIAEACSSFRRGGTSYAFARRIRKTLEAGRKWAQLRDGLTRPIVGPRSVTLRQACLYLARIARDVDTTQKRRDRERVVEALQARADGGDPIAQLWLESGLLSTLCVRAAGAGRKANVRALEEYLEESGARAAAEERFCHSIEGPYQPTLDAVCASLAKHIWAVLATAHPRIAAMHVHLRAAARQCVKANQAVSWTAPGSGLSIQQPYMRRVKLGQCKVTIVGIERRPAYYGDTSDVCSRRQVNRVGANFVRSVDAALTALTVNAAAEADIECLAIADGVIIGLAADVDLISDRVRKVATEALASWDIEAHLREQWPQIAPEL